MSSPENKKESKWFFFSFSGSLLSYYIALVYMYCISYYLHPKLDVPVDFGHVTLGALTVYFRNLFFYFFFYK